MDLNNRPLPIPPSAMPQGPSPSSVSIHDIIQIRIGLDTIKDPSDLLKSAIAHLDRVINLFTASLKG